MKYLLTLLCALFVSCSGGGQTPAGDITEGEISIAYLKSLCRGDRYRIVSDYTISGTVVANDWLGELYKSVVVEDSTTGIEIAIDSHNIAGWLPIYSKVKILCNGLMLARVGGKIELGAPPTGDFLLDNIAEDRASHIIRVVGVDEEYAPAVKSIADIGVADVGTLVRLDNLRIVDEEQGLSWCDSVEGEFVTTMRRATDEFGNGIAIRTLASCRYASQTMPVGLFSAVGIVEYTNSTYALRIVNKMILY